MSIGFYTDDDMDYNTAYRTSEANFSQALLARGRVFSFHLKWDYWISNSGSKFEPKQITFRRFTTIVSGYERSVITLPVA